MGSSEDPISDKSSAASDVFESSFSSSSSVQDKKVLPAPSKVMARVLNMKIFLLCSNTKKKLNIVYFLI